MRWTVLGAPPHPPRARGLLVLVALVVVCFGSGCSGPEGQVLEHWTVHIRDRSDPIEFPVHLNDQLPNRIEPYRLTATVTLDADLRSRDLDLAIPYLPAPVSLRVDGAPVAPAPGSEPIHRHVGPHRWAI